MDGDLATTVIAGGSVNTGVLVWLITSMLKLQRKVDRIGVEILYLRRTVGVRPVPTEAQDE